MVAIEVLSIDVNRFMSKETQWLLSANISGFSHANQKSHSNTVGASADTFSIPHRFLIHLREERIRENIFTILKYVFFLIVLCPRTNYSYNVVFNENKTT